MFTWKSACLACVLLSVTAGLPLHYGSLPVQSGADAWPVPLLLGLGLLAAAVSIIAGCVCCQRLGKGPPAAIQGFNNATYDPTPGGELTLFPPISAVSGPAGPGGRPQFEPLPELTAAAAAAAAHPRPAIYNLSVSRGFSAKDWFDDPHRNFPRQQLKYQQELGTGWFGQALLGEARNLTAEPKTEVVVKALRAGATLPEQMYFLHEMSYLRDANHPHVLRLLGRCVEADPYLLILERCGVGDAKEFLQRRSPTERQQLLETMTLNKMAMDAASGLQHLHDIHYTHSDLAARSCRVMNNCTLKLGDYGCNIDKYKEDYYIAGDVALPVRWCAPEILECTPTTIETKEITKASNVWSLGVLMWELLAFAALPYAPLSDDDVIQHVVMDRNVQLSRPKLSTGSPHTDRMYHVMQLCWLLPSQRPTVHRIHALLSQLTVPPRDDFEERWEALRPRGRADGGSGSDTPEPAASQPASLDSELHDALRSLDRMLAAEETTAEPTAGVSAAGGDGSGDASGLTEDADGESGGGGESEEETGELSANVREQSRSVQDFLTLTAPMDSLEFGSERTESDPEQEGAPLATQQGVTPALESVLALQESVAPPQELKEQEKGNERQEKRQDEREAPVSMAPYRPPTEGAPHGSGTNTALCSQPSPLSPPQPTPLPTQPPPAPPPAQLVPPVQAPYVVESPSGGGGEEGTGDAGGVVGDGGDVGDAGDTGEVGDARDVSGAHPVVEDPREGDGKDSGSFVPHAVPQLCLTEATPPRPLPMGEDGPQTSPAEEPPVSQPRAFRFVLNEKSEGSSEIALETEVNLEPSVELSVEPSTEPSLEPSAEPNVGPSVRSSVELSVEASTTAASEYFTAADSTLACAGDSTVDEGLANVSLDTSAAGDSGETVALKRQLTSTPRGRRSPSFNEYIESSYQTATESLPDNSNATLMGSRHSAPVYSPLARDDVSVGSEAGCDAALLAGEPRDDDGTDVAMSDIRQELKGEVKPPGGEGDVPRAVGTVTKEPTGLGESPIPTSPALLDSSEAAEPGSPPRSPSLSSTFGHSTCDELAELPDEEEVRSLCSRAEIAPSKLWDSAEGPVGSPGRPDRRLSADVITVIEAVPGRDQPMIGDGAVLTEEGPESADTTPVLAEELLVGESQTQKSADVTPVLGEDLLMLGEESQESQRSQKSADVTPVLGEDLLMLGEESQESQRSQKSVDVTPVMVEGLVVGEACKESQESPESVDVTPIIDEDLLVLEKGSQESQESAKPANTTLVLAETATENAISQVIEYNSKIPSESQLPEKTTPAEQLWLDFEKPGDTGEVSALVSVQTPFDEDVSMTTEGQHSTEGGTPVEESSVDAVSQAERQEAPTKDSTLSKDVASPDQVASKSDEHKLVDFSTPEIGAPTGLLRGPTAEKSSASETSTLPSEQTSSPTESSPSVLLTLGEDVLAIKDEASARLEGAASLIDDGSSPIAGSLPLLDSPWAPTGTDSKEGQTELPSEEATRTVSEALAVPGGGAGSDDFLSSLDGSGGFELTVGELQMPMTTSDATTEASTEASTEVTTDPIAATTSIIADVNDEAEAASAVDATSATAIAAVADAVLAPTIDGAEATCAAAAAAAVTAESISEATATSLSAEDPSHKYRLSSEEVESGAEAEHAAIVAESDPPPSGVPDSSAKYLVASEPTTAPSAAEGSVDAPQNQQQDRWLEYEQQPQEWDSGPAEGEDAEFWEGLRRAAEQTQALMAEAQRQSPKKNYRSMFLGDTDDSAAPSATSSASAVLEDHASALANSGAEKSGFKKSEMDLDDVVFSRHARQDSGGFDPIGPPAGGSGGAAFDPLDLELELEEDLDPVLGEEQEEAALAAIRAELRRGLPELDSTAAEPGEEQEELAVGEAAMICPPAVPGLETISEEAEEDEEGDDEDEDRPPDQIPDSWRDDFDDFVEVEIRPADGASDHPPDQQASSALPDSAAAEGDSKTTPNLARDLGEVLDTKPSDAANQAVRQAETNGQQNISQLSNITKQVPLAGVTDVEARLITEIELTNAEPFKHPTDVINTSDVEALKRTNDVKITSDVMSMRGEPDGSHDVDPPASGLLEFGETLPKPDSVLAGPETVVSNGVSVGEKIVNGLAKREEDVTGGQKPLVTGLNGDLSDTAVGEAAVDAGDVSGEVGDDVVTSAPGEVGDIFGDAGDGAEPRENGTSDASVQGLAPEGDISKGADSLSKLTESAAKSIEEATKLTKVAPKSSESESKFAKSVSKSAELKAASVEGAILIPGVGDVYSSLTYEPPTTTDVSKSSDVTSTVTDVTSTINGNASEPLHTSPASGDVTSELKAQADDRGTDSAAKTSEVSAPTASASTRPVSANLLAELKALASSAVSQPPSMDTTAAKHDGKLHQENHHHHQSHHQKQERTAAGEPTLLLQDLESPTTTLPAASATAAGAGVGCRRQSVPESRSAPVSSSHLDGRPEARSEPRLDSLSDSDASDVLEVDTESLEARLVEGGRPRSHVAFVLRAEPVGTAAAAAVSSAHAQMQGEDERPLEARFDLTQETEVRGDQVGRLEETRGDVGDDSDYEGDYESLPVDVSGPGSAAAAGAAPAAGLTRSVASYNLAAGAATPGWQGLSESHPDWQYPAPGSGPASSTAGAGAAAAGVSVGAQSQLPPAVLEGMGMLGERGQPASLPAVAGYTGYAVLSQGEMYHKVERRSSLPAAGQCPSASLPPTALTAEELDIDASIPTYDDVRRFDDSDDGLSSSSDSEIGDATAPWRLRYARTQTLQDEETVEATEEDVGVEGSDEEIVWGDGKGGESEREGGESGEKRRGSDEMSVGSEEKVNDEIADNGKAERPEKMIGGEERVEGRERAGGDEEKGDSRGEGELGVDESGDMLERPHRPAPGAHAPLVCAGESEEALTGVSDFGATTEAAALMEPTEAEAEAGTAPKAAELVAAAAPVETHDQETEEVDGVIFDRLERPMRPEPGVHPPLDDPEGVSGAPEDAIGPAEGAIGPAEGATARVEGAIAPEESRWSPDAPSAGGEAGFLDDDAPWSPADSLAIRERLQLLNEEYDEDCGVPERTERLRRLNEEWGVPQPGEEPARYTPDWEPDDDDDDGLSSTSGEFVWQEGVDRLAAETRDSESASDAASDSESESGEEEFTPSVWQQDKEPGHGLLRSPERKSELRKSVSFKRQKHHRIYEYPGAPPSPDLGTTEAEQLATAAQEQRKAWSFVAPASVSHYTDWELDDEEIEDVSLTELPESPDRPPPRLPLPSAPAGAAAASHYFLAAGDGDDDDDGDEFFIQPGLTAGAYRGGSSFTPGEMFPGQGDAWGAEGGEGNVWGSEMTQGDVWGRVVEEVRDEEGEGEKVDVWGSRLTSEMTPAAPEGRFVDVWSRGGAGVAEEVVSPDVAEKPIVSTSSAVASASNTAQKSATDDASEAITTEVVTTLNPVRLPDETQTDVEPSETPCEPGVEDLLTSDVVEETERAAQGVTTAEVKTQEERERIGLTEGGDAAEPAMREERDQAAGSQSTADGAQSTADGAQSTADGAQSTADGAQSTADGAQSTGGGAQSTADGAQSTADGAQSTADGARSTGDGAQSTADGAQSTADGAQSTADGARSTGGGAQSTADGAQSTADGARSTADGAQSTGDGAQSTADGAQSTADGARSTGDGAQSTADGAQSTADGARSTGGGAQSTADGAQSTADGARSTGDGAQSTADGAQSTADGARSTGGGAQSTADGAQSTADGARSTGGGARSTGDGAQSTADGAQSTADGAQSTGGGAQSTEATPTTLPSASVAADADAFAAAPAADVATRAAAPLTNDTANRVGDGTPTGTVSNDAASTDSAATSTSDIPASSTVVEAAVLTDASSSTAFSPEGALAGASAPDTFSPDAERQARPARDKLFLDLTGAPTDTVDSGYTGSCDDRTVAAFVALDDLVG